MDNSNEFRLTWLVDLVTAFFLAALSVVLLDQYFGLNVIEPIINAVKDWQKRAEELKILRRMWGE